MRAGWTVFLLLLTVWLACRAMPPRVTPSHDAQIMAASSPGAPFEPSSPDPAQRQPAPFVVEILDAFVLTDEASGASIIEVEDDVGPSSSHARRVDRPPIPPLFPS